MKRRRRSWRAACLFGVFHLLAWSSVGWAGSEPADPYYDAQGFKEHRGLWVGAPSERIDLFTGGVVLAVTDFTLPGNGGLDLTIQRVYNSKIFNATGTGYLRSSWAGLGWSLHFSLDKFLSEGV